MRTKFLTAKLNRKHHLEDTFVPDGSIIMVVKVSYTLGIWAGVGLREHGDDKCSIWRRNSSWAVEKRLASVVLVKRSEWPWPNLAISLQHFPGHSVRASSQEQFSASIGSRFWAVQANIHRCTTCSCAVRLDPTGQDAAHQRYANTHVRCLVALKRRYVQHRRNGLYLTRKVTHSAAYLLTYLLHGAESFLRS